jgi:hypothetical protein
MDRVEPIVHERDLVPDELEYFPQAFGDFNVIVENQYSFCLCHGDRSPTHATQKWIAFRPAYGIGSSPDRKQISFVWNLPGFR